MSKNHSSEIIGESCSRDANHTQTESLSRRDIAYLIQKRDQMQEENVDTNILDGSVSMDDI